ncbi:type II toxin-antitoxin system RelE/ParE family toxin [Desulfomonile tiedjei]|uniref:Phage derived protein Gp49-like (DUF891) n=1 Tax=Desulfomonile tiedjei (strain ATCC 49306 / DSM 6799 / DCB-1) TaxID=706587 RepID=I4C8P9_DESTA|nr:type II toxin-antitoxin system RelE/ParE family toxin [Desulfomonile tiedjei]AFM25940.1 Phage derived protein Gp49-like (DUF891) [Desulfomonile tiedjei DSM 6799]
MRYVLRFLPDVEEDVVTAYRWYEDKAPGLGEEFLRMLYVCLEGIRRNPLSSSKVYREIQRIDGGARLKLIDRMKKLEIGGPLVWQDYPDHFESLGDGLFQIRIYYRDIWYRLIYFLRRKKLLSVMVSSRRQTKLLPRNVRSP